MGGNCCNLLMFITLLPVMSMSENHTRTYSDIIRAGNIAVLQYDSIYFDFEHLFFLIWMLYHIELNLSPFD